MSRVAMETDLGVIELELVEQHAPAPRFGRTAASPVRPPPAAGADTAAVLQDIGFSEQRIAEFHEENMAPVVGLREGAWLLVEKGTVRLAGSTGARLFRRGEAAVEWVAGSRLDFLLDRTRQV